VNEQLTVIVSVGYCDQERCKITDYFVMKNAVAREYSEEEEQCKSNLITTEATKHVFHYWLKISIVEYLFSARHAKAL
jgi:hypothetical protein